MRMNLLAAAALLVAGPALADVKAGVDAWSQGDYRKAVEEWRGPAVAGDADAQYNLGQAYKLGRGVPVDPALAESWFRKAALQGHELAVDNYGIALFQSGRKQDAVQWLEKSVARDEPRTELVYGTMLFNGDGVPRDYPRAYALMTRAAAARGNASGLTSAQETLAQMDGYISPADRERGTKLAQQYAAMTAARPLGAVRTGTVEATTPRPAEPMRTAEVPPSKVPEPTASPRKPVRGAMPKPMKAPAVAATSAKPAEKPADQPAVASTQPKPADQPAVASAQPKPEKVPAKPAPAARGGRWKVQLGAFRDRGNAETLWSQVSGKFAGATPVYVAAGGVTRLQAGGFASRAEAQGACRRAGVSCIVIAP